MKTILVLAAMAIFSNTDTETIQVEVTNLRTNQGHVLIALYNKAKGFPTDPGRNGVAKGEFADIPFA
ncbi:hypothetical protein BN8_04142 [Fibrisoma limi BUZ 3]|uniref:Uncharacterized protein n=1 Tax=Fibrisoma limi BUZ 3 TaxID=1185876 RepID=I2GLZ7_9BACT|nr:hypothetical protein [Fibrisoma limi]CCH54923.1 hypothetical protein BN8_04142 [Fibrisoma limi BUZ 3]